MHVSEESHLEELLAKRLNNHLGGFAGNQRKLSELELYCSKGYFFFFYRGLFNKFEMCTTPVALGTPCHLVRLGKLLPACSLCERVRNLKGWRDCQNSKWFQASSSASLEWSGQPSWFPPPPPPKLLMPGIVDVSSECHPVYLKVIGLYNRNFISSFAN